MQISNTSLSVFLTLYKYNHSVYILFFLSFYFNFKFVTHRVAIVHSVSVFFRAHHTRVPQNTYLWCNGHLSDFQIWASINNVAVNILEQISVCHVYTFLWAIYTKERNFWVFVGNVFSQVVPIERQNVEQLIACLLTSARKLI